MLNLGKFDYVTKFTNLINFENVRKLGNFENPFAPLVMRPLVDEPDLTGYEND